MRVLKAVALSGVVLVAGLDVVTDSQETVGAMGFGFGDWSGPSENDTDPDEKWENGGVKFAPWIRRARWTVFNASVDNQSFDISAVTMGVDSIQELNADGEDVCASNFVSQLWCRPRHGFPKLSWFPLMDDRVVTKDLDATNGTAKGNYISMATKNSHDSSFKLELFFVKETGMIGPDMGDKGGPEWEAKAGTVKFNFIFENWNWCTGAVTDSSCPGGTEGKFIDLKMFVLSKKSTTPFVSRNGTQVPGVGRSRFAFELGGDLDFEYTSEVTVDGIATNMTDGYPKQESRSRTVWGKTVQWQELTFRFPKFNNKLAYDPAVAPSSENDDSGATTVGPGMALFAMMYTLLGLAQK